MGFLPRYTGLSKKKKSWENLANGTCPLKKLTKFKSLYKGSILAGQIWAGIKGAIIAWYALICKSRAYSKQGIELSEIEFVENL